MLLVLPRSHSQPVHEAAAPFERTEPDSSSATQRFTLKFARHVGLAVGTEVIGAAVGTMTGAGVGARVGLAEGLGVGTAVGRADGAGVGDNVGVGIGAISGG